MLHIGACVCLLEEIMQYFLFCCRYNKTSSPIWWPDLVQNKDRSRYFTCQSETDNKLFHMKVYVQKHAHIIYTGFYSYKN